MLRLCETFRVASPLSHSNMKSSLDIVCVLQFVMLLQYCINTTTCENVESFFPGLLHNRKRILISEWTSRKVRSQCIWSLNQWNSWHQGIFYRPIDIVRNTTRSDVVLYYCLNKSLVIITGPSLGFAALSNLVYRFLYYVVGQVSLVAQRLYTYPI